jgi:hypothetical protein
MRYYQRMHEEETFGEEVKPCAYHEHSSEEDRKKCQQGLEED